MTVRTLKRTLKYVGPGVACLSSMIPPFSSLYIPPFLPTATPLICLRDIEVH